MVYLKLLRAHQWVKNVFVFAGLIFARKLYDVDALLMATGGFFCLCFVSSAVYIVNDLRDRVEDQQHPRKRFRPIAAGLISPQQAWLIGIACLVGGLLGSYLLSPQFALLALSYFALQATYTFVLKRRVLLDVMAIALGFVLRAVSGAVLVAVEISPWLILCTFTLCLFLGFSKRKCELRAFADEEPEVASAHRKTLAAYTDELLSRYTTISAGIAVISFMLYATDPSTVQKFDTNALAYTLPLVVYAIFRFDFLVDRGGVDGPTDVVLGDRPFQFTVLLWAILATLIINFGAGIDGWLHAAPPPT